MQPLLELQPSSSGPRVRHAVFVLLRVARKPPSFATLVAHTRVVKCGLREPECLRSVRVCSFLLGQPGNDKWAERGLDFILVASDMMWCGGGGERARGGLVQLHSTFCRFPSALSKPMLELHCVQDLKHSVARAHAATLSGDEPYARVQVYRVPDPADARADVAKLPSPRREWVPTALKTQVALAAKMDSDITCGCVRSTVFLAFLPACTHSDSASNHDGLRQHIRAADVVCEHKTHWKSGLSCASVQFPTACWFACSCFFTRGGIHA
jgi:hypothetical protein